MTRTNTPGIESMSSKTTRPIYLEVSSHFFHDAADFEVRFRHCYYSKDISFDTPRSRKVKTFIDLRMGIESILKSLVVYYESSSKQGKNLVNWIEKFSHNIEKSLNKVEIHLTDQFLNQYRDCLLELHELPIGLRYRLDAWDFHDNQEEKYAQTIASQTWMELVYEALKELIGLANFELSKHNRIVKASELHAEIFEPRYEKYKK